VRYPEQDATPPLVGNAVSHSSFVIRHFSRIQVAEQGRSGESIHVQMIDPSPYRSVAVASTFSPRFEQVLAEAKRIRDRFDSELCLV